MRAHSPRGPVAASDIRLSPTRGTPKRGGDPGGQAWAIEAAGERAGLVFINRIEEAPFGQHASIQIYLNRANQGRQIGRTAYRLACEASGYDEIFAHMRKSNIASRRAAEAAGFADATPPQHRQLVLRWNRARSNDTTPSG